MNPLQEAEFHLSIYHYFLWKSAQERARENASVQQQQNAAAVLATPAPATADPNPNAVDDGDKKRPAQVTATTNDDKAPPVTTEKSKEGEETPAAKPFAVTAPTPKLAESQRYQTLVDAMLQQFPQHLAHFPPQNSMMQNQMPPIITTLYMDYPAMQSEIFAARNRIAQLESMLAAASQPPTLNAKHVGITTTVPGKNKRKEPPAAAAGGDGAKAGGAAPKRVRLSIANRPDVPDGMYYAVCGVLLK